MSLPDWNLNEAQTWQTLEVLLAFAGALALFLLLRALVLRKLRTTHISGEKHYGQLIASALSTSSLLWSIAAALEFGIGFAAIPIRFASTADLLIRIFVILSVTMAASALLIRLLTAYGQARHVPFAVAGLSRALIRVLVFGIGILVLLNSMGFHITPLLTALGVGGLAVALALQDTLANLFAGMLLLIEAPLAVGDMIRIGDGPEEGVVVDIGWRTTRLLSENNTLVVPNKIITSGALLNYDMPDARVIATIPVLTSLEADPDLLMRVALEVARGTAGVVSDVPPVLVADPGMLPTHLQYKLIFTVERKRDGEGVKTAVVNRILKRFQSEKIPLPDLSRTAVVKS